MDWQDALARLRDRLPELECQIGKFGAYFPLSLLPPGLFREVSSGEDCIQEIARDLRAISNETPECVLQYWSQRLSQKINVLVHICCTHKPTIPSRNAMDRMGTHLQWLEQTQMKQQQLVQQRSAFIATLKTMREREDQEAIQTLQKEIQDLDAQITALQALS